MTEQRIYANAALARVHDYIEHAAELTADALDEFADYRDPAVLDLLEERVTVLFDKIRSTLVEFTEKPASMDEAIEEALVPYSQLRGLGGLTLTMMDVGRVKRDSANHLYYDGLRHIHLITKLMREGAEAESS